MVDRSHYLEKFTGKYWDPEVLKELVEKSNQKELSIRFLEDFVLELYLQAKNDNDNKITKALTDQVFEEMKEKYVQSWTEWLKKGAHDHWDKACKLIMNVY